MTLSYLSYETPSKRQGGRGISEGGKREKIIEPLVALEQVASAYISPSLKEAMDVIAGLPLCFSKTLHSAFSDIFSTVLRLAHEVCVYLYIYIYVKMVDLSAYFGIYVCERKRDVLFFIQM